MLISAGGGDAVGYVVGTEIYMYKLCVCTHTCLCMEGSWAGVTCRCAWASDYA